MSEFSMRNYLLLTIVIFLFIQMPEVNGDDFYKKYDYYSRQYELNGNYISQIITIHTYNDPPIRCFLHYGGGSKYNSWIDDMDPSNLEIEINDKRIHYTTMNLFNSQNQKDIKEGFSFFDVCGSCLEFDVIYREKMLKLCEEEDLAKKSILILDQKPSSRCIFKIKITDYDSMHHIESNFLKKKFLTSFLLPYESDPFVVEIKLPEKVEIINYNLKEYESSVDKNRIKWVISESPDERMQFWVEYKPSIALIIDKISENNIVRLVTLFLSFAGVMGLSNFIKRRIHKGTKKH